MVKSVFQRVKGEGRDLRARSKRRLLAQMFNKVHIGSGKL
jgi:hypothetical protein